MIHTLFKFLSLAVVIYTFMCFIRIFLSWFPGKLYTPFGRFLLKFCDPYLNLFHFKWLKFSAFDFSPALGICVLFIISSILTGVAENQTFSLGILIATLVSMVWSLCSSILAIFMIIIIIRLIVLMVSNNYGNGNSIWDQLDRTLSPIIFRVSAVFSNGKPTSLKKALLISLAVLFVIWFAGKILIGYLATILASLPI